MSVLTEQQRAKWAASTGHSEWSADRVNYPCDLVAYGHGFVLIGRTLGVSTDAAKARFDRVRRSMGWQAV